MDERPISFGSFRLVPSQRLLLAGDKPMRLGSRAFDILAALVERAGEVVSKDELIARAWPTTVVEEGNLKLQISALRRALGDGGASRYIVTVPGRGYNFVAPVSREAEPRGAPSPLVAVPRLHNLPFAVTRIIGREDTVAALVSRLAGDRLVTLVGPGGVGKTTAALAVAEELVSAYEHGVWLIDLAPLTEPSLVASTVATVLGVETHAADPLPGLVSSLRHKRMLLLLDNCEHLIEAAATLAAMLLRGAPGVSMLATSREPLGVEGEREYRLGPLAMPSPSSSRLAAADALVFPAVQLFVERVSSAIDDSALSDADAPFVVEICRRVDGLPLGIEFAAARVDVLGIRALAANLHDGLRLLEGRRRTAMPRQRTIRAVLDWSHGLLREDEKRFFRRLGIFSSSFSIEAAARVAMDAAKPPGDAMDSLADLVAKSLVTADVSRAEPRFRLLETTRLYALEKLAETNELETVARRHAEHQRAIFERAEVQLEARLLAEWLPGNAWRINDLRAALDWAFSPKGDVSIGVALTAAAAPLWVHLSLMEECRGQVEQALAAIRGGQHSDQRSEMKLHAALANSVIFARGAFPEIRAAWAKVHEIAEALDDDEYRLRATTGLWNVCNDSGEYRGALIQAQKFRSLAEKRRDPGDLLVSERMIAASRYFMGDYLSARRSVEHVLAEYVPSDRRTQIIRFQFDLRLRTRVLLARVLWSQGFPEQAMSAARDSLEDARATDHANSLCYSLALAGCPLALLVGDLAAADHYVAMLLDLSTTHGLALWRACGLSYQGALVSRRGDVINGLQLLREGFEQLDHDWYAAFNIVILMSETLGRAGQIGDGLAAVDNGIARCERTEGRWLISELLRVKGELLLLQGGAGVAETAEDYFRQALDWARRQGALSWELRAAISLARLWHGQGQVAEARRLLRPVYDRFTEGFHTADLIAAKRLLDEMNDVCRE